jgi:hypothetical protein
MSTDLIPRAPVSLVEELNKRAAGHPLGRAARLGLIGLLFGLAVALEVPLCPFALLTHHPCPGCGLTRATLALVRGDLGGALRLHPLSPLVSPLVVVIFAYNAVVYVREGRWAAAEGLHGRAVTSLALLLFVALLAVWIARYLGALGGPVPV